MEKKKILIFEDEWATIRGSFEMANIYAFNNTFAFDVINKSQDISFYAWEDKYIAVFVDITLAKNTKLDGYNILKEIKEKNLISMDKVFVLTGNSKIPEKLEEMGINPSELKILYKPLGFDELSKHLKKVYNIKEI